MDFRIETIQDIKVVGMRSQASFMTINEKTKALAQSFMPRRHEISSRIGNHVFSIQNYGDSFNISNPNSEFEKWVAVEVNDLKNFPQSMESLVLKAGKYTVFPFKGSVTEFPKFRAHIFNNWLPQSNYKTDDRAHFEILNENYSKDLQNIEEDVWKPIQIR